jgi:Tol biopolymer transport system component
MNVGRLNRSTRPQRITARLVRVRFQLLLVGLVSALLVGVVNAGGTAAAAPARASANENWILLSSNRDGKTRMYSIDEDGSRLTPLFPPGRWLAPVAVSRDGSTIAYRADPDRPKAIYVSRADGTGFHRLIRKGLDPAFSPNGRLLAFTTGSGIWIVGIDGHGLRRLTSGDDEAFDWSPDGQALVFMRSIAKNIYGGGRYALVLKPLRGKARVIVRTGPNEDDNQELYQPKWAPNGRWIAYFNVEDNRHKNGLTVVRPSGKRRHRVVLGAGEEETFQWSPDGRWLAFEDGTELDYILPSGKWHKIWAHAAGPVAWSPDGKRMAFVVSAGEAGDVAVAGADGQGLRRLHLGVAGRGLTWLPDASGIVFAGSTGGDPTQIWVVGGDGEGLRRLTNEGTNDVVGWTRLAPVLPPASPLSPTEHVLDARTVATSTPVSALSADGSRVAFAPRPTVTDCEHVVVWHPGDDLARLGNLPAPCPGYGGGVTSLVLAGSRAAWLQSGSGDDRCEFALRSATLADPVPRGVSVGEVYGGSCESRDIDHLRGDGDLLVFNDEPSHATWLVQIGAGVNKCGELVCTTLRKGRQASPVDSVSGTLIATRTHAAVSVLDNHGVLVRSFRFTPADVYAARLDGGRLVVARSYTIESYLVATGAQEYSRPIPPGYELTDVDDGIAVLRRTDSVILVRLGDGASLRLTPGQGPVLADLEAPGLYYSYATEDGGGRVAFLPRADVLRQLGGGS